MARHSRLSRREFLGAGAAALAADEAGAQAEAAFPVRPYISSEKHLEPVRYAPGRRARQSFYLQPWRGFMETVPARQMLDGLGVVYNVPGGAGHDAAFGLLASAGFRTCRIEMSWNALKWEEDGLIPSEARRFGLVLAAAKAHGFRPLILLNANHGAPCPHKTHPRTAPAGGRKGDRTLRLDSVEDLKAGYSGLSGPFPRLPMAGLRFLDVDAATDTVTLSKPLPDDLSQGAKVLCHTLKYRPLYPVNTPEFEETAGGWLRYVRLVCAFVKAQGFLSFDVEIWNELGFGSNFLDVQNYHEPKLALGKPAVLSNPGSANWELARRTVPQVHAGVPGSRVIWGFSNTTAFRTPVSALPPGTDGQSYHPYGAGRRMAPWDKRDRESAEWFVEGRRPLDVPMALPEGWAHTAIKAESLIPLLEPNHRRANRPPGTPAFRHYFTEHGFYPVDVKVSGAEASWNYKARSILRGTLFWLNKGLSGVYLYGAWGKEVEGFGLLPAPADVSKLAPGTPLSPPLRVLKNAVARFAGARDIASPRPLEADVTALGREQTTAFGGDGGALPPLPHRELFALLPFQVSEKRFVCAAYVMTYDILAPFAPMRFRVRLRGVRGAGAQASLYDPHTDAAVPLKITARAADSITFEFEATDTPRLLTLQEA